MSVSDAFGPVDAVNRAIVAANTWGHLAPEPRRPYPGYIVFTYGQWGDIIPIDAAFVGLPDSPWFYDDLCSFIDDRAVTRGTIYRFDGSYMKYKNGKGCFRGTIRTLVWEDHDPVLSK